MNRLNAYVEPDVELRAEAEGPLSGRVFAVKDVFDIAGYTSGAGNPDWRRTHGPAVRTAPAIERLLRSGARMRGTTVTDELMYSLQGENIHYGTPVNPNAAGRVPGGSSSGSASAVAGGLADFALGTDTGGSIRIPASYCGVYGFRPGHGNVPADGVIPLAPSFDTVGWLCRDAALLHEVGRALLADPASGAAEAPPPAKRGFGELLLPSEAWGLVDDGAKRELLGLLAPLGGGSLPQRRIALPGGDLGEWAETFRAIQGIEIWAQHGEWIRSVRPAFGPGIAERFAWASALPTDGKEALYARKRAIGCSLEAALGADGLLVLPTAAGEAPPVGVVGELAEQQRTRTMKLTCIAGLSGLPQATVPLRREGGGPIGLSFVAGRGRDLDLLRWLRERFGGAEGGSAS